MMTCYCFKRQNGCGCRQNNTGRQGCRQHTNWQGQGNSWQGGQGYCGGRHSGNNGGWVSGNHSCANDWRFCKCPRQNNSWDYDGEYEEENFYY